MSERLEEAEEAFEETSPEDTGEEQVVPAEGLGETDDRIKALERELGEKTSETEGYLQQLQRLQADFANFRKRMRREMEELRERVTGDILCQMLPVVDNLERAVCAAEQEGASLENLGAGVVMVHRQLGDLLLKEGVSPMTSQGEVFDPVKHHAVATVDSEELPEDTVVDELSKGYYFCGKVMRPAMVRVAKRPIQKEGEGNG